MLTQIWHYVNRTTLQVSEMIDDKIQKEEDNEDMICCNLENAWISWGEKSLYRIDMVKDTYIVEG